MKVICYQRLSYSEYRDDPHLMVVCPSQRTNHDRRCNFHDSFCITSNFLLGELPGADVAKNLLEAIRAKKDVDQLQTILNNIPANATGREDFNTDGMGDKFCFLHFYRLYCRPFIVSVCFYANLNYRQTKQTNHCSESVHECYSQYDGV